MLDESLSDKFEQAKNDGNTVAAAGVWITDERFQFALGVTARTKSVIQARPDNLYHGLPQRIGQAERVAADAASKFSRRWTSSLCQHFKRHPGTAATQLENRHPGSTRPSGAKYGRGQFRGQSGARGARAPARREDSLTSLQLIGPRLGRGGSAQCRKAGRGRGKKISDELGQSLRRCEIGVGKIHVLVDARAIEFRHTVFSRPMHGQTGWNRMVLFITRDSSDINAADEFA